MCEVIRLAIEEEQQLQDASVLEDKEFFIDDDIHVFKTPTPEPVPSPREDMYTDTFTCMQLEQLAKQVFSFACFQKILRDFHDPLKNYDHFVKTRLYTRYKNRNSTEKIRCYWDNLWVHMELVGVFLKL